MRSLMPALISLIALAPATAVAADPLSVQSPRCEYQTDPLGIDERSPRLSWQLVSRERRQRQTAYQVLVATSAAALRDGRADLWNSGKVTSGESAHVAYQGKPLTSGQQCFWQVRVWDGEGKPGPYSRPAMWEMGLLEAADWKGPWVGLPVGASQSTFDLAGAPWIWYPEGNPAQFAPGGIRYFRRSVTLPAGRQPVRATFYLAVDNQFTLYVNGKELGQGSGWQSATPIDILPQLRAGENTFAVAANNMDEKGGPAGLLGRLQVQFASGAPITLDIDGSWKAANQAVAGWQNAGFDDRSWPTAKVLGPGGIAPWGPTKAGGGDPGPASYLRSEFALNKPVRRARAYVSALGVYQLYVNGKRIGDDVLSPGWTDYRKRVQYLTYDVTDAVQRGRNAVGAIVGDGWYAGSLGFDLSRNHFGPSPARVRVQLNVEYTDGTSRSVATDEAWQGTIGPILESDLYAGEVYDARRELDDWANPGGGKGRGRSSRDDGAAEGWKPVSVYQDRQPEMNAHVGPPIRITEELRTQAVTEPKRHVYVFDLGQNMVGRARLRIDGARGTRVTLRFAEVLNPDGTVYRENLRRARATDTYILRGGGEEVYEPHFTYHGFRYVEVTGLTSKPSPSAITGQVFHSAMTPTSRFRCSSELVNRLYRNVVWGQRANMMSVPTDCPQRDE
ncbi:MAG: Alfa-L-rhamnosidase, partial [Armatimonadetes bacterium]|nr:Alfa-L-rhamnosidase [Armatimonadota bacterium]